MRKLGDVESSAGAAEPALARARAGVEGPPARDAASSKDALVVEFEGKARGRPLRGAPLDARRLVRRRRAVASGQVPLPPYIKREVRARGRAALPDGLRARRGRRGGADGGAPPHAGAHRATRVAGLRDRNVYSARRSRYVPAGDRRRPRRSPDARRVLRGAARARRGASRARASAERRCSPSGTTVVRALESAADPDAARARPRVRRGDAHPDPARLHVPRRRSAAHELPPAEVDAARARLRVRGHRRACSRRTRTAVKERYRFFSYGDAMLLDRASQAQAPMTAPAHARLRVPRPRAATGHARAAVLHDAARRGRDADVHARRHAGKREGAHPGRGRRDGRAHRARKHVPPVAAPRPGGRVAARAGSTASRAGRTRCSPTPGGFQAFSLGAGSGGKDPLVKLDEDGLHVPLASRRLEARSSRPKRRCACRGSSAPTSRCSSTSVRRASRGAPVVEARRARARRAGRGARSRRRARSGRRSSESCRAHASPTCAARTPRSSRRSRSTARASTASRSAASRVGEPIPRMYETLARGRAPSSIPSARAT